MRVIIQDSKPSIMSARYWSHEVVMLIAGRFGDLIKDAPKYIKGIN